MRIVDKKILKYLRGRPCKVCKYSHSVAHHIKSQGSGGDDAEYNLMVLCLEHHRQVHDKGLRLFVEKYPHLVPELKEKGWELDEFSNKWIRLTNEGWDD